MQPSEYGHIKLSTHEQEEGTRSFVWGNWEVLHRDTVVLSFKKCIEGLQRNKERRAWAETQKRKGTQCVQEAVKSSLLGDRYGERKERVEEAAVEAAEEYA